MSPHTDDAELGCGGTMARLLEEGKDVFVAAFSTARQSLPAGADPNTLKDEFFESMQLLGIPRDNLYIYDYEVRKFSYFRQEVLEDLVKLRRYINPDVVLLPSGSDVHQDHRVLHDEGLRAFKTLTVLGYELPWNNITFSAEAFVTLAERHVAAKWRALQMYRSQFELQRNYFSLDFIKGLARVRGVQVGELYAEAFEVVRMKW